MGKVSKKSKIVGLKSFSFETTILRTEEDSDGIKYLIGCASSDSKDNHNTVFNQTCQLGFVEDCQSSNVLVELFHGENNPTRFPYFIGTVVEANVQYNEEDEKTSFIVKIKLNPKNPFADWVYDITLNPNTEFGEPIKLALSIHGTVKKSHYELINGERIRVFDRVQLTHIAITDRPSNVDTFLEAISRSLDSIEEEVNREMAYFAKDEKGRIKASDIKAILDKDVNEMVDTITKIESSGLTFENVLKAVRMFVNDYSCKISDLCYDGAYWQQVVDDVEQVISLESPEVKTDLVESRELSQNNFLERIDNKIQEVKMIQEKIEETIVPEANVSSDNISREENLDGTKSVEQTSVANTPNSDTGCNSEDSSANTRCDNEVIQDKPESVIEADIVSREPEVKVEEKVETISREEFLTVIENAKSLLTKVETLEATNNELTEKLTTVSREFEAFKQSPASTPANLIGDVDTLISRESKKSDKDRYLAGEMTDKEAEAFRGKAARQFFGLKQ